MCPMRVSLSFRVDPGCAAGRVSDRKRVLQALRLCWRGLRPPRSSAGQPASVRDAPPETMSILILLFDLYATLAIEHRKKKNRKFLCLRQKFGYKSPCSLLPGWSLLPRSKLLARRAQDSFEQRVPNLLLGDSSRSKYREVGVLNLVGNTYVNNVDDLFCVPNTRCFCRGRRVRQPCLTLSVNGRRCQRRLPCTAP